MLFHVLTFFVPGAGDLQDTQDRESSPGAHVLSKECLFLLQSLLLLQMPLFPPAYTFLPKTKPFLVVSGTFPSHAAVPQLTARFMPSTHRLCETGDQKSLFFLDFLKPF